MFLTANRVWADPGIRAYIIAVRMGTCDFVASRRDGRCLTQPMEGKMALAIYGLIAYGQRISSSG